MEPVTDCADDEWETIVSGPYCPHWWDVSEGCPEPCDGCGHACSDHGCNLDDPCAAAGCGCAGFSGDGADEYPTLCYDTYIHPLK